MLRGGIFLKENALGIYLNSKPAAKNRRNIEGKWISSLTGEESNSKATQSNFRHRRIYELAMSLVFETRKETHMSRVCELTGKAPMTGNNVSHANNKTKRRFLPNLNDVTLTSEALGQSFRFRISAAALRTVDHRGGLDGFMAKAKEAELSAKALKVKKDIAKAKAEA